MNKLLVLVSLLAMAAIPMFAQGGPATGPFLVDYFSNNDGTPNLWNVRLVNWGGFGTPLNSPGIVDVCANIYVFDANQEMIECCSCRISPNGVLTLTAFNLTDNPVTSVEPVNGDIMIVSTIPIGPCSPVSYNGGLRDGIVGFGTHVEVVGAGAFITETNIPNTNNNPSSAELNFLTQACQFARYLGSGKGVCSCNVD